MAATEPTSRNCSRSAPNARWPCRRSSRSHGVAGATPTRRRFSWYEPIDDVDVATRAVHFVLANAQVFLNTSSDARLLELTCDAAEAFDGTAPSADQLAADRLAHAMTPLFDGAALEVI